MKIFGRNTQKSDRIQAAKSLRSMAKRRKNKSGSHLLAIAAEHTVQGDDSSARLTIERFELVASKLSRDDTAKLQCVKESLSRPAKSSVVASLAKTIVIAGLKFALSAVSVSYTHLDVYKRQDL